jgi:SAM-dependent methyltransferase
MYRTIIQAFRKRTARLRFRNSQDYWERRYAQGGNSGSGSYGELAKFKAEVLNHFLLTHRINSVIEFGCGDGNQLSMVNYRQYIGVDVSQTALNLCRARFAGDPTKTFLLSEQYGGQTAECAISLDVLYHLVEDQVFAGYMRNLFSSASRFVIIYTSNVLPHELEIRNSLISGHVRHRYVTGYVAENYSLWKLAERIPKSYAYNQKTRDCSFTQFSYLV